MDTPDSAATSANVGETQLTRQEKEKLLRSMYTLSHWIAIIRLFGYQTLPMDRAREAIKPIADEFGKEKVADACEVLVEIRNQDKEPFARLKPHIRRMSFQILGPEPDVATVAPSQEEPVAPAQSRQTDRRGSRRKVEQTPAPAACAEPKVANPNDSAIMKQYQAAKERHPNMMLLFRMGDFYELFGDDAETAHKLLGLTLTTRDRTLTMAGFPHHQLETYLHKLLHAGQRVAICEPVEESLARGPIRREVTRVVTSGTMIEDASDEQAHDGLDDQASTTTERRPVHQPRVFVLKQYEACLNKAGMSFVAVDEVRRTTPGVAAHVGGLDFIVLRGDDKLLVTVRPHLQAKHISAIRELQQLFGAEYKSRRVWPVDGPGGWDWLEHPVDLSAAGPPNAGRVKKTKGSPIKQRPKL